MPTIVVDAGHGGWDNGASYQGRLEKDDVLRLALEVGSILESYGFNVFYTRTEDVFVRPYQRAVDANELGADFFLSIHRNSSPTPNQYNGVESLVYSMGGFPELVATNINAQLERVGFRNIRVIERKNLIVLNSTEMPAVLVEVGFINSDIDNQIFDENFNAIAYAIADGVTMSFYPENYR